MTSGQGGGWQSQWGHHGACSVAVMSAGGEGAGVHVHSHSSAAQEAAGSCGGCPEPGKDKGTQGERRERRVVPTLRAWEPRPGPGPGPLPLQVAFWGGGRPRSECRGRGGHDRGKRLARMWLRTAHPSLFHDPQPGHHVRLQSRSVTLSLPRPGPAVLSEHPIKVSLPPQCFSTPDPVLTLFVGLICWEITVLICSLFSVCISPGGLRLLRAQNKTWLRLHEAKDGCRASSSDTKGWNSLHPGDPLLKGPQTFRAVMFNLFHRMAHVN